MLKPQEKAPRQPLSRSGLEPLSFQYERFIKIAKELAPLMLQQWRENPHSDKFEFEIDWERAFALDLTGVVHVLTARDNGRLVGYVVNTVVYPITNATTKWCYVDAIYLDQAYREGWNGINLIKKNEKGMRKLGVNVIKLSCPPGSFETVLKRLDYKILEVSAFKNL